METKVERDTWSPQLNIIRKLHSLFQPSKSTQNFQCFTNRLDFSSRKEPQNDVGDLPKLLVDYWSHPKFISIWLVVICCPEGETKAGWLPWHRLDPDGPRQKGMDGCTLSANYVPSTTQRAQVQTKANLCRFDRASPLISISTLLSEWIRILTVVQFDWVVF